MPTRQTTKRAASDKIQGEGSYVIFKRVTVGEFRSLQNEQGEKSLIEVGLQLIETHLIDWNWVDDEGKTLPLPSEDPSVIDNLYDEEATFLAEALLGDQKN